MASEWEDVPDSEWEDVPADQANALADVQKRTAADLVRAGPAAPKPMGAFQTFLDRSLNAALPGHRMLDQGAAASKAAGEAGKSVFSSRLAHPNINRVAPTPASVVSDDEQSDMAGRRGEIQQDLGLEAAAAGRAHPIAAGVGNIVGMVGGAAVDPVFSGGARTAIGLARPAVRGLAEGLGGGLLGRLVGGTVGGGLAGGAIGGMAAARAGMNPSEGIPMGVAVGAAPVIAGAGMAASALQPGITGEERVTRALGGVLPVAAGSAQALSDLAPSMRNGADWSAARAIYGQKIREIRRAGGYEGAMKAARTAMDEGAVGFGDTEAGIGEKAVNLRDAKGREQAANQDKLSHLMTPEQSARMRPFVVGAKARMDLQDQYAPVGADRDLLPKASKIGKQLSDAGGEDQTPWTFQQLNEQKTALNDRGYARPDPRNPDPMSRVYQDAGRSVNEHMENIGGELSNQAGAEEFARWLANKETYGDLAKVSEAGDAARNRALSNRGVSLSDYQVGTGGGVSTGSMLKAFLNKQLRQRGNSATAVTMDKLGQLGEKIPSVWGEAKTPMETPPPAAPTPVTAPPVTPPPEGAPQLGPAGPPEGTPFLPGPKYSPNQPLVNKAENMAFADLLQRLIKKQPSELHSIINPETGEVLLPASGTGSLSYEPAGPLDIPSELPAAVTPAREGALEALTPRLKALLGAPDAPLSSTRVIRSTKRSPTRK